jgi:hypothetical protein
MTHYLAVWTLDFDLAGDPVQAAKHAQDIMRDPQFDWKLVVTDVDTGKTVEVDLDVVIAEEILAEITGVKAIQTIDECRKKYPKTDQIPYRECQICKAFADCRGGEKILQRANVTRSE